jgi:starvation-inducible DNA-binding protein
MSTAVERRISLAVIATWSDIAPNAADEIGGALTTLLADVFTLYLKMKNFHWHMSGRHFRDHHLMLDEQAIAMTDLIAERVRSAAGLSDRSERSPAGSGSRTVMPAKCRPEAC